MGFAPETILQSLPAYLSEFWKDDGWTEMLRKAVMQAGRDFGRVGFASHCRG